MNMNVNMNKWFACDTQVLYEFNRLSAQGKSHYLELREHHGMNHREAYLKALSGDSNRWYL